MIKQIVSETITENIFRNFHGAKTFIEKSAIPKSKGFRSKNGTDYKGYPDFYKDETDYAIVVEAKANDHQKAKAEVQFYMSENKIVKDIFGIAISGQNVETLKVSYFTKINNIIKELPVKDTLISLFDIQRKYRKSRYGESISADKLKTLLNSLNKKFNDGNKVRDTDRSLFFSGLMIALTDVNFRNTYKNISAPSSQPDSRIIMVESDNLNKSILSAIETQIQHKVNNLSKEFNWKDRFSFIKTIDYPLDEYKEIIESIETNIFYPFQNEEKQDILGKAYKTFLSRAGKIDNKNIILTPDHIKALMVKLAGLSIDDVVLDTCTGTGGFLMEAMETLMYLASENTKKIEHIKEKQLIGFEIDPILFALACSNLFLHGDGRSNLIYRSSLLNDEKENIVNSTNEDLLKYIKSLKPTKCIINPPYENNNAFKFTQQALDYLESNGKLIIIMPSNTLTKNQSRKSMGTETLLKSATLDFVIKMPFNLFNEQKRTVNTSIFGFTKTPHNKNKEVLFCALEDDGLVSIQHKGRVDKYNKWDGIQNTIIDAVLNSKEIEGICEKRKIYKGDLLNAAGILNNDSSLKMVKINEIFDIEKGTLQSEDNVEGEYNFITAGKEWKTHEAYEHDKEAIIYAVAASGSLGRSHYVNGKFIASSLCLILTPKKDSKYPVNLQFYNEYFSVVRKKIIADLADGTSKLTIKPEDLSEYYIDYIPLEKQKKLLSVILEQHKKVQELQKQVEKTENEINNSIKALL